MVTLTPDMAGNVLLATAISYIFVIGYSVYMLIIGRKQARVYNQMQEVIGLLKEIRDNKRGK